MVENSFNIIVLDGYENFITFLDSNKCDIEETRSVDAHRTIKMTYPVDEKINVTLTEWFRHGNKIFIPETLGIDSCLYVINTEYSVDYSDKNEVEVELEEVLVELNYESFASYETEPLPVTTENLEKWFGRFYDIGEIDTLDSVKKTINPRGTMSLMELYSLIESSTGRVFVTEYTNENNTITRKLHLKKEANLRKVAQTEYLNLNFNLDSLDFVKDEEDSFLAMAPKLKVNEGAVAQTPMDSLSLQKGNMVSASTVNTSNLTLSLEDAKTIYDAWVAFGVEYREYIPMIVEKASDGSILTPTAWWYAPFIKDPGTDYIYSPNRSNIDYVNYIPYNSDDPTLKPTPSLRKGFVETSETNPNAIYNALANALLNKQSSKFKLTVSVKDIQILLGQNNLGYQIYETLYVLPPGFDYYLPCYVTKTVKNPHQPGENKITLETDVSGTHAKEETEILAEDLIISYDESNATIGGQLVTKNGSPVTNVPISISIRLTKSYDKLDTSKKQINEFKPKEETYVFTEAEIKSLEEKMRYSLLTNNAYESNYVMKAVTGKKYSVPIVWALAIYNTRNQLFINSDNPVGLGQWKKSITVHYYENNKELLAEDDDIIYYPSRFYDIFYEISDEQQKMGFTEEPFPRVSSCEIQYNKDCVPAAISNASSLLKDYRTESELRQIFKTGNNGTELSNILPGLEALGYNFSIEDLSEESIQKNVQGDNKVALLICDTQQLNLGSQMYGDTHALLIYDWMVINDKMSIAVMDSTKPSFNPKNVNQYSYAAKDWYDIQTLVNATKITEENGQLSFTTGNAQKKMIVISNSTKNLPQETELVEITPDGVFDPMLNSYRFTPNEIKTVYAQVYNNIKTKSNMDNMTLNYSIYDINFIAYNLPGKWIQSLAYTVMYYYMNNYVFENNNLRATVSNDKTQVSLYYYNKIGTDTDYCTPINPAIHDGISVPLCVSTILFYQGYIVPPTSLLTDRTSAATKQIYDTEGITYNYYCHLIKEFGSKLNTYIVDFNVTNIKKYTMYATGSNTRYNNISCIYLHFRNNSTFSNMQVSSYSNTNSLIIFSHDDTQIYGLLPLAKGTDPRNDIITNSPYIHTEMNTLQTSTVNTEEQTKMIVVSRYTLTELEALYTSRGQK